ncbi:hypothetical protein IJ182_11105 [bacterium]|nr:hypothetical protein [bacterium]
MCDKKNVILEYLSKTGNSQSGISETINMTNPIKNSTANISDMVQKILDKELPMLKDNSLIHDLVLYNLLEKVKTVQTVENVLSYIKGKNVKEIRDVRFKNGEIYIKCSI